MRNTIWQNILSISFAVLVHVVFIGMLIFSFSDTITPRMQKPSSSSREEIVKAVVIDEARVQAELDKLKKEERRKRANEKARVKKLEEKARKAKLARKKEQKKLKEVKRKQALEKKRLKENQKKRAAQEKIEKRRLNDLKKKQSELEKKRKAEEKRLAELDARRKQAEKRQLAQEKKKREAALRKQMDAERQKELMGIREQYIAAIGDKVRRNWRRPPNVVKGAICTVLVNQLPGGMVNSVRVTNCTGTDEILRRSVRMAVLKADPLPRAPDPGVFDRDIKFDFIVEE